MLGQCNTPLNGNGRDAYDFISTPMEILTLVLQNLSYVILLTNTHCTNEILTVIKSVNNRITIIVIKHLPLIIDTKTKRYTTTRGSD